MFMGVSFQVISDKGWIAIISTFCMVMLILYFVRAGFGGAFWLELIGGMLLAVHKVLLRMALVRLIRYFGVILTGKKIMQ